MKKLLLLTFLFSSLLSFTQVNKTAKQIKNTKKSTDIEAKTSPSSLPTGTFIIENLQCAGLKFNTEKWITIVNELGCQSTEYIANWVNNKIFILTERSRVNKKNPPRVEVYEILSFDGETLKVKSFWTGWGVQKDEIIVLKKKK